MPDTTYHKIHAPFKRNMEPGPEKGKLIYGDWALPEFRYLAGNEWEFTEKVDGTNIRVIVERSDDYATITFGGRTDTAQIPKHLLEHLEATFTERVVTGALYGHLEVSDLKGTSDTVVLYGEGYGPKIQGGGKYRDDVSFVLFDVNYSGWWLDRENVNDIASKLGIDAVPVLGRGTLWDAMDIVRRSVNAFDPYPDLNREQEWPLISKWGNFEAEGIVARPTVPLFNRKGERIITKIKGADFK